MGNRLCVGERITVGQKDGTPDIQKYVAHDAEEFTIEKRTGPILRPGVMTVGSSSSYEKVRRSRPFYSQNVVTAVLKCSTEHPSEAR